MRRLISVVCIITFICLLSGCDSIFSNPENTLKATNITGDFQGVNDALEKKVGTAITLKYPLVDGVRSPFCAHDLDGDGVNEVLAFYKEAKEDAPPHINLLKLTKGDEWESKQDIAPVGNDLLEIAFADLDNDGIDEILTGWSNYTSKCNQMGVYRMEEGSLVQRGLEDYSAYIVCDIDSNGSEELGIAHINANTKAADFCFYYFKDNNFTLLCSGALDSNVTSYANIKLGKIGSKEAIFLDGHKAPEIVITEVLYYENAKLQNPFFDTVSSTNKTTLRYSPLYSQDINGDGFIDIPRGIAVKGTIGEVSDELNQIVRWFTFDGTKSTALFDAWYSTADGYYLDFDQTWLNNITVSYDYDLGLAMFNRFDEKTKAPAGELLRIRAITDKEWENNPPDKYVKIGQKDTKVYIARFSNLESPLYISPDALAQRFHIIETAEK